MWWWKKKAETKGADHDKALAQSSDAWLDRIADLRDQLAQEEHRQAQLAEDAGRAVLDGSPALVRDLTDAARRSELTIESLKAGIRLAEARHADAERDEDRKRAVLDVRQYFALTAEFLRREAAVRTAQRALGDAMVYRDQVPVAEIDRLYARLGGAGIRPKVGADAMMPEYGPDRVLKAAEEFQQLADSATITPSGQIELSGETISRAAIPLNGREREQAEQEAARADEPRRARLRDIRTELDNLRTSFHLNISLGVRDPHARTRAAEIREKIGALEAERAELEGVAA